MKILHFDDFHTTLTHPPPPKAYNFSHLKGTHNAPIGTIFPKILHLSHPTPSPLRLSCIPAKPKTYYAKEKLNTILFTFLLMNSLGKQAVSPGSIEIITLSFLVYVFKTHKNFSLHFFFKNGQVQYSFENKLI